MSFTVRFTPIESPKYEMKFFFISYDGKYLPGCILMAMLDPYYSYTDHTERTVTVRLLYVDTYQQSHCNHYSGRERHFFKVTGCSSDGTHVTCVPVIKTVEKNISP